MTASRFGLRDHLTHRGNLRSSRYGWLRLTPMYSVHLVEQLLDEDIHEGGRVLDPFCGTGTTALVCAERGIPCDTTDINPFLLWLTDAKCHAYSDVEIEAARSESELVTKAALDEPRGTPWVPPLKNIEKWWEAPMLGALARAWGRIKDSDPSLSPPSSWLLTLAFLRTAIRTAHVSFGHQSMSFKQPSPNGDEPLLLIEPTWMDRFVDEWSVAIDSITSAASSLILEQPRAIACDARALTTGVPSEAYESVITSPPYCNRMSYIRELRPYMYWTGHLADGRTAGELDWHAIGGTWGIATSKVAKWEPEQSVSIPYEGFDRIVAGIAKHSDLLSRYVAKYFHDAILHVEQLHEVVAPGGVVHYVVGNSKFYDVMVPVEQIYATLFRSIGFEAVEIQTIRKRTSKKELYEYLVSARKF